ncbi:MAG: dioxygenase [Proteobacteria bacterium]|nr:MAG: dioxygenase [Pseudomonadota bacterium]
MSHHDKESVLARDLQALNEQKMNRRRMFTWMATATAVPVLGGLLKSNLLKAQVANLPINQGGVTPPTAATCSVIPPETAGPYPGDGSNGANALGLSGIVRSDITTSVGTASGVAAGIPLRVELTLINAAGNCEPLVDYAVYIWHCDQIGDYSMYTGAAKTENYLRGVLASDAEGVVAFDSIFPGCYAGRWPHIHFEVYKSIETATTYRGKVATSQLALPPVPCKDVYATAGYEKSVRNLANISLARDNVFSDGVTLQLASVTGSVELGYVAKLTVAIKGS